jgi:hypothetical protein
MNKGLRPSTIFEIYFTYKKKKKTYFKLEVETFGFHRQTPHLMDWDFEQNLSLYVPKKSPHISLQI